MTLNYSDNVIRARAEAAEEAAVAEATLRGKKKAKRILGMPIPLAAAAAVAVVGGGVAFAAIALQSNETEAALAKGTAAELVLDQAQFTKPLFPGTSTGLKFRIINSNPFPATVKQVVLNGTSSTTCALADLTGPAANVGTVNGLVLTLTDPVVVPANNNVVFEYPKVVTLKPSAPDSCAITAKFKVTGSGAGSES